jgi:hypothetical protein
MSEKNDKHFLRSIFSRKDSSPDMRTDETDDYTIKRDQKIDVIIRILSILGAIFIWIYVVSTDVASYEFKNVEVELKNIEAVEAEGFTVDYDILYVTFKVQGSAGKVSGITEDSIKVYANLSSVDLSDIVGSKTIRMPIVYEIPKDLTCMEKSQDTIEVVISVSSPESAG